MRKLLLLFACVMTMFAVAEAEPVSQVRTLVVYYTYSGVTETLAQHIANECGGTLLQVEDHGNYPRPESQTTYNYANNERSQINAGNWPEIKTSVESFDEWDAIIICTPLWNGKMANPMLTFLHNHVDKLDHKQVALAVTSYSSGINGVVNDAHNYLPNSVFVGNPLHINYNQRTQMQQLAAEWLNTLDFELPKTDTMRVIVGDKVFPATLADNNTAEDFRELLPLTINMSELNGNEKYYYLSHSFTVDESVPDMIHAGDIMLYGRSCLVLFYQTFETTYAYTRLGAIHDPTGLAEALGSGSVTVTFELAEAVEGDVNGDGNLNIADVTALIDYLLGSGAHIDEQVADINGDEAVNIADVTDLIDKLLSK